MITPTMFVATIICIIAFLCIVGFANHLMKQRVPFGKVAIFKGAGFTAYDAYKSETGLAYIFINDDIFFIPLDRIEGVATSPGCPGLIFKWLTHPDKSFLSKDPQLDEV